MREHIGNARVGDGLLSERGHAATAFAHHLWQASLGKSWTDEGRRCGQGTQIEEQPATEHRRMLPSDREDARENLIPVQPTSLTTRHGPVPSSTSGREDGLALALDAPDVLFPVGFARRHSPELNASSGVADDSSRVVALDGEVADLHRPEELAAPGR